MTARQIVRGCILTALAFLPASLSAGGDGAAASRILSVRENTGSGSVVGEVDPDARGWTGRYTIASGNHEGAFSIDSVTGRLTVENPAALNHERRDRFDLVLDVTRPARDQAARRAFLRDMIDSGASLETVGQLLTDVDRMRVTVLVEDVAEQPVLPAQSATILVYGSEVVEDAWIAARDEDGDEALRFEIVGGAPAGLFEVESGSGQLSINNTLPLPPGDHRFPLTVMVTDSSGVSDATTIPVRVIALAGAPGSLVVAAPPRDADEARDSEVDLAAVPGEAGEEPAAVASEPAADSSAGSQPTPTDTDRGPRTVSGPPSDTAGSANPAPVSMARQLARVAGMFLLLGGVVAVVLWWLMRRARREPLDAFEDERLRRLRLMTEERSATHPAGELDPATESIEMEESVVHQLSGLQQLLADHTQVDRTADAQQDTARDVHAADEEEPIQVDSQSAVAHSLESLDSTRAADFQPGTSEPEASEEQWEVGRDELYEVAEDGSDEVTDGNGDWTAVESTHEFEAAGSETVDGAALDDSQFHRDDEPSTLPENQDLEEHVAQDVEATRWLSNQPDASSSGDDPVGTAADTSEESGANDGVPVADPTLQPDHDDSQLQPVPADSHLTWPADQEPAELAETETETCEILHADEDVAPTGDESAHVSHEESDRYDSAMVGELLESIRQELQAHPAAPTDPHPDSWSPDSFEPDAVPAGSADFQAMSGEAGRETDLLHDGLDTDDADDPRVRHLRDELVEKFGIGVPPSCGDGDSMLTEQVGPSTAESDIESGGAEIGWDGSAGATAPDLPSPDDLPLQGTEAEQSWGRGLSTARFLLSTPVEASPAGSEPEADPEPEAELDVPAPEVKPVKRRNKSEIRRQMSSLREVAIRHARSRMAQEAPRERTRQTWYVSASAMVVLNFSAMGVLSTAPGGPLKVIGWGLMIAGAGALAVCLHSFHQMTVSDGAQVSAVEDLAPAGDDTDGPGAEI